MSETIFKIWASVAMTPKIPKIQAKGLWQFSSHELAGRHEASGGDRGTPIWWNADRASVRANHRVARRA